MQRIADFIVNKRYIVLGFMLIIIIACGIAMPRVSSLKPYKSEPP